MNTYWITGASSGIGEALSKELNGHGHQVILSARNREKLSQIVAGLKYPDKARIVTFDLSRSENFPQVVDEVFGCFGKLDTVILNAGISQRSLFQDTTFQVYRDLMEVNYFGNVALSQAILPRFVEKNHGQFVIVSSLVGKFGTPFRTGYSASKHALHGFFDSLRAEMMMQDMNIGVTILCPGFVSTEISFNALGSEGKAIRIHDEANASGMNPEVFAKKAVAAIEAKKLEAYIGNKEIVGVYLKRFLPGLFAKIVAKAKVR